MKKYEERSKQVFNEKAECYDHDVIGTHAREMYPYMLKEIIHIYGDEVLDLGCGSGALLSQVVDEDSHRHLVGIDVCENMIRVAKQKLGKKAVLIQADALKLPFENNYFDIVFCNDSFHHYLDPQGVMKEIQRVLKVGGTLLIGESTLPMLGRVLMNMYFKIGKQGDVQMYTKKEFEEFFAPFFYAFSWEKVGKHGCIVKGIKR